MAYTDEVAADSPLYYWRLDAASGNEANAGSGGAITMNPNGTNPPTQNVSPNASWTGLNGKCWTFDGTNDCATTSGNLTLSGNPIITVELLLYWDAYANNYDVALEYTIDSSAVDQDGFVIMPNHAGGAGTFVYGFTRTEGGVKKDWYDNITRPAAATWHHLAFVFDRTNRVNKAYLNGALQTSLEIGPYTIGGGGSNWPNAPLFPMNRNSGAALHGGGKIDEIAIYGSELSSGRITAHYNALVASAAPVADFSGTPTTITSGQTVTFTDLSTNTPTSWSWEKNDGTGWVAFSNTPTAQNPTETFD